MIESNFLGLKGDQAKRKTALRLPKGFIFASVVKPLLRRLCATSLSISVVVALSDWLILMACAMAGSFVFVNFGWAVALPLHIFILWPLAARSLRGQENLVHEASHYNIDRRRHRLNDGVGNWLCGYWTLVSVQMFRETHDPHHHFFGSDRDPDAKRFARLGLDDIPRRFGRPLMRYLWRVMPLYVRGYWGQFAGKKGQAFGSTALHLSAMLVGSLLIDGWFWAYWLVYFILPFLMYLPFLRFFAEAEEHRYREAGSEFGATFSNLGRFQRWYLHPHGDAYHLLHHMLPQVPHWKMAATHWLLSAMEKRYGSARARRSIFEETKHERSSE